MTKKLPQLYDWKEVQSYKDKKNAERQKLNIKNNTHFESKKKKA